MNTYEQEPPNAVQVELVEGCNLWCEFCGLRGIREKAGDKNMKYMTPATLTRICSEIKRLGWNPRMEFAMHGEPTMHPDYIGMIRIVREVLPRQSIMMTSNGGGLLRPPGPVPNVHALFEAGLNILAFDDYQYVKIGEKIRFAFNYHPEVPFPTFEYPAQKEASPHTRAHYKERRFVFIKDISKAVDGTHADLNNHAGAAAPPPDVVYAKRCAKPFRELSFRWDGNVALCCNDWRGEFKVANINETPLEKLWQHPRFQAARRYLYHGERGGLSPCDKCDARSYRVGLLPDKLGKDSLPEPTTKDARLVREATAGRSYTTPVKRPWEK